MEAHTDYSRKWLVMTAVAAGTLLTTIDGNIVNVALPTLVRELQTNFAAVQWVVLSYLLALATLMLSLGRLGDMIGKKPIYVAGFIIFTTGSVLCALAPDIYWLIVFRIVQAIGGAMLLSLSMAIVTQAFPPQERGRALGLNGTFVSVGIVAGPTLGGLLLSITTWHWIFLVNLPVGIVGTILAIRYIPVPQSRENQQFDYFGAGTLFVGLLSLLLALTIGQQRGFGDTAVLILFAIFVLFLALFIIIENRTPQPMIDLRMFANKLFSINLITGFATFVAISGTTLLMPFYLENILGFSTSHIGLLMAVVPLFLGVVAPLSGSLSDRFGTRPITVAGLFMLILGYWAMSTLNQQTTGLGFVLRMLPVGVGMGMFQSPNNSAVMGSVTRQRLGIASGLLAISRTLGQTAGVALMGALWAGRTMIYEGTVLAGGATAATAVAQISGLHDTFRFMVLLMLAALVLAVWALVKEKELHPIGQSSQT
ncbi:MAG: MFS transporter [Ardenticatenaceae bacterium]|nr:MFS transporter [Ardenticatenaceae bacterium]MCB9444375.1 MFS transporter [Ardenticatenaceae bacterium]